MKERDRRIAGQRVRGIEGQGEGKVERLGEDSLLNISELKRQSFLLHNQK